MAIDISQIANEINRSLREYANGVGDEIEEIAERLAKEGVRKLKATSPVRNGKYRRGWRAKKVNGVWTVYNATSYQLTHLLENGHAKVDGGRVSPVVHIRPVEEQLIEDFMREVERAIQG